MKYVKRPVSVDAIVFEDTSECCQGLQQLGMDPVRISYVDPETPVLVIATMEGEMRAHVGDYVVKGVKGEFYPCREDVFDETYALADMDPQTESL